MNNRFDHKRSSTRQPKPRRDAFSISDVARRIIYEDNHLLVFSKPVGLATMGASSNEESLFTLAQQYIKIKYQKPGAVYLGVVSRLDLPVSGVVVFARTSKAASRLNEQFRNQTVQKTYLALVEGRLYPDEAELVNVICEDKVHRRLWIPRSLDESVKPFDPKEARLKYKVLNRFALTTLIEVSLLTGRKHQIRLQLSHQGAPIIGDGKYGAKPIAEPGICLHAFQLSLIHPTTKESMTFDSPLPDWSRWK